MSAILNWTDAVQMLHAYQTNSRALQQNPPNGTQILRGFRVDRAEIQTIMSNTDVQDVIIMPAVSLADVTKPEADQEFTMILAGTDSQGDIVTNAVVDYMTSCPVNCPKNYPVK